MSSSSKFISHPQFIDEKPLCNADALLFAGMTQAHGTDVHHNMNAFIDSLSELLLHLSIQQMSVIFVFKTQFWYEVVSFFLLYQFYCLVVFSIVTEVTMDRGGNMLVPTQPCGVVLDLITRLSESSVIDSNRDFTIYFVSPTAKGCLSFSQIYAEWQFSEILGGLFIQLTKYCFRLQAERHNHAYQPQPPFHHNELVELGKLKVKASVKGWYFFIEVKNSLILFYKSNIVCQIILLLQLLIVYCCLFNVDK